MEKSKLFLSGQRRNPPEFAQRNLGEDLSYFGPNLDSQALLELLMDTEFKLEGYETGTESGSFAVEHWYTWKSIADEILMIETALSNAVSKTMS